MEPDLLPLPTLPLAAAAEALRACSAEFREIALLQLEQMLLLAVQHVRDAREAGYRDGYAAALAEVSRLSAAEVRDVGVAEIES